jgi:dienelactone hydrolase
MGGQESLSANLNNSEAVSATVIIYGFGFDKIDTKRLERIKGPVLAIAGSEDSEAVQAAIKFLSNMKVAKRPYEMLSIPVRTTVTRNHSSTKERITTRRPFIPPG